eukprot:Rhum_TRINITY_DN15253_c8_g1::Rhum_TRINITY_DN15253_c8_g1_i1::g.146684::m.146684
MNVNVDRVSDSIVTSGDVIASLNVLDERQLSDFLPQSRIGRGPSASGMRVRSSSVGANQSSNASTYGCSDDDAASCPRSSGCSAGEPSEDAASTGSATPPTRALALSKEMMQARRSPVVNRQQQMKANAALQRKIDEHEAFLRSEAARDDSKPAAVTAALVTFMMAMLSCPLGSCLPPTHVHLSRLPIGMGHSVVIDALRREWPGHEFNIKLHVYQKTRHVSGVASITPGLIPEDIEMLRGRADNMYLPLATGDKMIVEESKRDRDMHLYARYRTMVLQGLGENVEGAEPLCEAQSEVIHSPIVYLRVMADRTPSNGLLMNVSEIKDEGLVSLLDKFPGSKGCSLSETVHLIAPDKSTNRQHMHRSHFGRAYFLECTDEAAARNLMEQVQADSVQTLLGMRFSLHVEMKKGAVNKNGQAARLFEQDTHKRQIMERHLEASKKVVDGLDQSPCACMLPERHQMGLHSLFLFRGFRKGVPETEQSSSPSTYQESAVGDGASTYDGFSAHTTTQRGSQGCHNGYAESTCGAESVYESAHVDTASAVGTDFGTEVESYETHQPYNCPTNYGQGYSYQQYAPHYPAQQQQQQQQQ